MLGRRNRERCTQAHGHCASPASVAVLTFVPRSLRGSQMDVRI